MAETNKKFSELTPREKDDYFKSLEETSKLFRLQADIAYEKARLQKAIYEQLAYAVKVAEFTNPPKESNSNNNEESQPNPNKN